MPKPILQVFDKNLKRLGVLNKAYGTERRRRLNSDYELSFFVPMASEDYIEKIKIKGHVRDEKGQYYVINTRNRDRKQKGLIALITCTHIMFKLGDFKVPYDEYIEEAYGVHISTLLNKISAWTGGRFTFQVHDTFDLWDIKDFGRTNSLAALNDVLNIYGAEIRPDNFVLHIHKKTGDQTKQHEYRVRKNIISDSFKDDATGLVTRMFAQMKDGRTWIGLPVEHLTAEELSLLQSVPGAIQNGKIMVNYLISPYVNYWGSDSVPFFDGENIQQDIEDPLELLKSTREELRKKETPELEITVNAADLHKKDRSETPPDLGDAALVYDPKMEMNRIDVRITELVEYPDALDKHSRVTLSNFALKDDVDLIADLERSRKVMDNLLSGGRIRTEAFETAAKQAIIDINNSKTELIYPPEGGILAQEKTNPLEQVRLTSKGLGISTDGWQTVRSAITARGVLAETVIGQFGNFVSMLIGSGNNVTQINTNGIAAGHADFYQAPFQLDMLGNLTANKLTANYAQIKRSAFTDGDIVGSSINVGNGQFTVSSSGFMYAVGGYFSGDITASTITGSVIQTSSSTQRLAFEPDGFRSYDPYGIKRISIDTAGYGYQELRFFGQNGGQVGTISGTNSLLNVTAASGSSLILGGATLYVGGEVQTFNFQSVTVRGFPMSNVDGLTAEIQRIWSAIADKAPAQHTHNVTIPNHNHGNTANTTSGGGTFRTT